MFMCAYNIDGTQFKEILHSCNMYSTKISTKRNIFISYLHNPETKSSCTGNKDSPQDYTGGTGPPQNWSIWNGYDQGRQYPHIQ